MRRPFFAVSLPFAAPLAAALRPAALAVLLGVSAHPAQAEMPSPFARSLAVAAAGDEAVAGWYQHSAYAPLWTGPDHAGRRAALLGALDRVADHGLPVPRYGADQLRSLLRGATTEGDRAEAELALTRAYLLYARDLTSGALIPAEIDPTIKREIAVIDPAQHLAAISAAGDGAEAASVLQSLVPTSLVYAQLMRAKFDLEARIAEGGWGSPVTAASGPGDSGPAVVALRDRLIRMGYLDRSITALYDAQIVKAVTAFELDHGLTPDGIADAATLDELNVPAGTRLGSVIVAMERERWMKIDRVARHIWVNQPDFMARVVDHGRTVFETRVVIGKDEADQRSPEFSDQMEFMVINPSWSVPRSITVNEYLPLLQRNPNAVSHLKVIDGNGRVVSRGAVNFAAYTARNFPFALRQPPSDGNALGLVKFMFPNVHNIYLHDTPSKSLFAHETRAYSHGCIRVADPFELAYLLLGAQETDPNGLFHAKLATGAETKVDLVTPVPVHLVYFTAYPTQTGRIGYRRDVYGRDAKLLSALVAAGVALPGVQG